MAKIKGNGSLERRSDNTWKMSVSLGADPISGKRRRVSKSFHGNKTEAKRALANWISEIENGLKPQAEKVTLAAYAEKWHTMREMVQAVKPSTLYGEQVTLRRVCKYLGNAAVCDLDPSTIRSFYMKLHDDGISPHGVRNVHIKLKQMLNDAVEDGLLLKNPCNPVKVPKPAMQHERQSLSKDEAVRLRELLDADGDIDARIMAVRLGLATGMRKGEVLGLTWGCVDFDKHTLRVIQQLTPRGIASTKTASGNRMLSIDAATAKHLKQWKKNQKEYLQQLFVKQTPKSPVITDEVGGWHDTDNFYRWFKDFCVCNGFGRYVDNRGKPIPPQRFNENGMAVDADGKPYSRTNKKKRINKHYQGLKFHELRHTQATLLIADGVDPKTVQARLGHSNVALTLDLYAHATRENDRLAADLIGEILSKKNVSETVNFEKMAPDAKSTGSLLAPKLHIIRGGNRNRSEASSL